MYICISVELALHSYLLVENRIVATQTTHAHTAASEDNLICEWKKAA